LHETKTALAAPFAVEANGDCKSGDDWKIPLEALAVPLVEGLYKYDG